MVDIQTSDVISKINAVMMDAFELPENKLVPEAHLFSDLGLDSLDAIDLMMRFQDEFGIRLPNDELMAIRTLSDVHNLGRKYAVQETQGH